MSDASLSAEEVANRRFTTAFRGLDSDEVYGYLGELAERLRSLRQHEEDLQRRLAEAEHRASHPEWDEVAVSNAIGEQTSRILSSAQTVAHELKAKAEENAARILREAHAEAQRIRAAAESVLVERTDEAEAEAAKIRRAVQSEADTVRETSRSEAELTVSQAAARATAMVEEAQSTQQRILSELARRRRVAQIQLEQLRAGRERLLEAYRVVRRTLDEVVNELQRAEPEARLAAEAAVRRLTSPAADVAEVEPEGDENDGGHARLPEGQLEVVRPPSDIEAVRIIGSAGPPAPERGREYAAQTEEELEPERVASVAEAAQSEPEPETVAPVEAPVAEAPELEPEPESPVAEVPEPEPEPEESPVQPEAVPDLDEAKDEVLSDVVDLPGMEASSGSDPMSPIDELFARIRADRAAAVARAREVLADEGRLPAAGPSRSREPARAESSRVAYADPDAGFVAETGEAPLTQEDVAELERRDAALEPITTGLARRLKRVLQDEQNEVLDRLRSGRQRSGRRAAAEILAPSDDQAVRYAGVGEEPLRLAAAVGSHFFSARSGAPPDVTDVALQLAEALARPLRRQLEEALGDTGDGQPADVDRIGAAYRECKVQRVDGLAADAVISAFSRGILAGAADVPLRWVVRDESGPCPDCDDNALAGPTSVGEEYPTGQQHPPAHAGCRCLLLPVSASAPA